MKPISKRKFIAISSKLLLSIGLFWYVISQTKFSEITDLLIDIDLWLFAVVIGLIVFEKIVACYRWYLLLIVTKRHVPFWQLLRIYLISSGLGSFSPGGLGGDALKVCAITTASSEIPSVVSSIVADRFFGFLSLLALSFGCLLLVRENTPDIFNIVRSMSFIAIFALAGSLMVFSKQTEKLLGRYKHIRYLGKIFETAAKVRSLCMDCAVVTRGLLVSMLVHLVRVIYVYVLALSIDIQTSLIYFLIFIPIVFFMQQLPISINGIGLSQGLYLLFFSTRGMSTSEAFTLSTGIMLLGYVVVLIGGLLYLTGGLKYKEGDFSLKEQIEKQN